MIGVAPASFFVSASTMIQEIGSALDSPVEEARFELLVPPKERGRSEDANVWKRWYVFTRHRAATELVLGGRSDAE
jgi:hypothetical protein